MKVIGLTGGIGSGKSTIACELIRRGCRVYDCDKEAKRIIARNAEVRESIISLLGDKAFDGGSYNTAYVSHRVFSEPDLLKQLNAIVHPAVIKDIRTLTQSDVCHSSVLFIESAILYESGIDALCDSVIVVDAPVELRIERAIARDYKGEATPENRRKIYARIQSQSANKHEAKMGGKKIWVVVNDGTLTIADIADKVLKIVTDA